MESRHSSKNLFEFIISVVAFVLTVYAYDRNTPGETFPDKVEIEIGDSANISCSMNLALFPYKNSSELYFINAATQEEVPQKDIVVWNASTIVFMLRNAKEQQKTYTCKIGSDAIMETRVYVGTRPMEALDFVCRSYDFEYMVCNFTQPYNTILTPYNLTFYTHSEDYRYPMSCNTDEKPYIVCNTTTQTYKPKVETYRFKLTGSNLLETREFFYEINNWNNMIPAQPGLDFRIIEISTNALDIAWRMPKYDYYKRRGNSTLQWEVILKPDHLDEQNLSNVVPVFFYRNELKLHLTNLPYAYYWYELRLRVRVSNAPPNDESMWSEPFAYRFQTNASKPDQAPRTDVGSFYIDPTETQVRIYWEQLQYYEENGANFSYSINATKQLGNSISQLQPNQLELNSAKFPWQKNAYYKFTIKSRNHVGESHKESIIEIFPIKYNNVKKYIPRLIQNVYHASNRTYTLTWQPPYDFKNLQDFTVFWCNSKRALQNECEGSIHFKHLSKNSTKFITDPQLAHNERSLNLAVSANYINYNTGMHWTACSSDVNSDLEKMEPDAQPISSHSIHIQWSSEKVCPSILDGYNLTYCEVDDNISCEQTICLGKQISIPIKDRNAKQYILDELEPYTLYRIEMFMYSRVKFGKSSDPICNRTNEAAPTEPRHLEYLSIFNTSAIISWLPPSQPNGNIRHYVVNLNNEQRIVKPNLDNRDPGAKIVYELKNLSSYTAYKVYVTAETVDSSPTSNDIHFTTFIGYPSPPGSAISTRDTINNTIIQWSKPTTPSGRVDFYEVAVIVKRYEEIIRKRISIVIGATSCAVKIPICLDHEYKTIIDVRAVNAAEKPREVVSYDYDSVLIDADETPEYYEDNEDLSCIGGETQSARLQNYRDHSTYKLYKSPWQHGPTYNCSANRLSQITVIALMVVVFALCLMTALYFARKKYYKMANIDCTLPPGLDSYPTKIGIDNETLDKHELDHHRSKELIFHNEKHHLLDSVGNDSGYLDGRTLNNSNTDKILNYMRNTSESSTDSVVESSTDSIEPHVEENTEQLNMENIQKSVLDQPMHILPVNNGYIKPNKVKNWQSPEELPTTSQCGGYISLGNIGLAPFNSNGYVQPQAIEKNFLHTTGTNNVDNTNYSVDCLNTGYTTLDELDKSTVDAPQQENLRAIIDTGNVNASSLISGYVTQRDLTAFGQQHCT